MILLLSKRPRVACVRTTSLTHRHARNYFVMRVLWLQEHEMIVLCRPCDHAEFDFRFLICHCWGSGSNPVPAKAGFHFASEVLQGSTSCLKNFPARSAKENCAFMDGVAFEDRHDEDKSIEGLNAKHSSHFQALGRSVFAALN